MFSNSSTLKCESCDIRMTRFFILYFYCSRVTCSIKQFVRSSWYQLIPDYPPFSTKPISTSYNFLYRSRPQAKHCNFLCICQKWWIGLIKHPISIHSNLIIFKFQKFTFNLKRFRGHFVSFISKSFGWWKLNFSPHPVSCHVGLLQWVLNEISFSTL